MRKNNFWLVAILGVCAAVVVTSCSNDAVNDDLDGALVTKANPGAYQVKSVTVTSEGNATPTTFTYNADGKIATATTVQYGNTKVATYDYATAGKVIVTVVDPSLGEDKSYTYDLNGNGYATSVVGAYVSDGYVEDKLNFTYTDNRLTTIEYGESGETDWEFSTYYTFTYKAGTVTDLATLSEQGTAGTCSVSRTYLNRVSFDLNLFATIVAGQNLGDPFDYAVYGDLFPNTAHLVTRVRLDADNYVDYSYNLVGTDKVTDCTVTSYWAEPDEDTGETVPMSSTFGITLGY